MVLDVAVQVRLVPNLQLPREIEVALILKINMQAPITVFLTHKPVLQSEFVLPIVHQIQILLDLLCRQNDPGAKNVIEPIVDEILIFTLGKSLDFVVNALASLDAIKKA